MAKKTPKTKGYWVNRRTWTHPVTQTKYATGLMGLCRQICIERCLAPNQNYPNAEYPLCEWCGEPIYKYANMHHIWGRNLSENVRTLWMPDMCAMLHPMKCHTEGTLDKMAVHDDDGAAREYFGEKRGVGWYMKMMKMMREHVTWTMVDPEQEEFDLLLILHYISLNGPLKAPERP